MNIQRSIVVKRIPGYKSWLFLAFLSVVIVSLSIGYSFSRSTLKELTAEKNKATNLVSELELLLAETNRQTQILKLDNEVDSIALENSRQELILLQGRLDANEEQLLLYRELLQEDDQSNGLSVVRFELQELSKKQFSYRWIAKQRTEKMGLANVIAEVFVIGEFEGQSSSIGLSDLDAEIDEFPIQLKFKYFSINQGTLEFPDGFDPAEVKFDLRYSWNKKKAYTETFDWMVGS